MIEDLLLQVMKPARYIAEEWNICRKRFDEADVTFALGFPDLYEIGMSNLGVRILYGMLNSRPGIICERFFAPAADWEGILRSKGEGLTSLESKKRLSDFDIVGFSLGYELCYTTVLSMLELGGIPLNSCERSQDFPLVIAGGPCAFNPEPMHAFFDLFIIGEAEEALLEFCALYQKHKHRLKSGALAKEEFLLHSSSIAGVYVPSLYEVEYDGQGRVKEFRPRFKEAPKRVLKRFVQDFDNAFFPVQWLVPYIQTVHDRITLEIMRGCPNSCRFCQARQQYYPFRLRALEKIVEQAKATYLATGYEELALTGLSASDYPDLGRLFGILIKYFCDKGVGISLPSIKPHPQIGEVSSLIATIKKTGLTFAPEAGSEKMRRLLSKNFNVEEFFTILSQAYESGYQHVKLYFMFGVPFEGDEDLAGIIELAVRVSQLRRKPGVSAAGVNLSINPLIPKPHTPLQWFAMEGLKGLEQKQRYLLDLAKRHRKLKLSFHDPRMSLLEAILSRGDRRLSKVILRVFKEGGRLESWEENFSWDRWMRALGAEDLNPDCYLRAKDLTETLPWDFIDTGFSREALRRDFETITAKELL